MLNFFLACLVAALVVTGGDGFVRGAAQPEPQSTFASRIAALSEPAGYFDTDNLISNERSYLHVLSDLRRGGVRGGAYIGVGPDQNFSYIAHARPTIAFILDVRRDNLLLHLFFKALFSLSRTRVEYLALLTGRPVPEPPDGWRTRPIADLVAYIDSARPLDHRLVDASSQRAVRRIAGFGFKLSGSDAITIQRFHRRFVEAGLALQFQSFGRPPQPYNPTYRQLLLETDRDGRPGNFLASEETFQFVRLLQGRDLVIPVVGNFSGPSALAAIGRLLRARGERVSAFYASNVEFYLFRDESFPRFIANLGHLPRTSHAILIRSVFDRGQSLPGYASVSITQPLGELIDGYAQGRFRRYWELTGR